MTPYSLQEKDVKRLLDWFEENTRDLPWRDETRNPYHVWISEVMLQQTRVETVIPYFRRFIETFPNIETLAGASEDDVLNQWEGLGFYARARNLHKAAREVVDEYNGTLPEDPGELEELPGIGPSTSAAISSLAFNRPVPYLDGNVFRVMSRYLGYTENTKTSEGTSFIREAVRNSMPENHPGMFNESVIELGAIVCTPRSPDCGICPLRDGCVAREEELQETLPYTGESLDRPTRTRCAVVLRSERGVLMVKRPSDGLLGGMWEVPALWNDGDETREETALRTLNWLISDQNPPLEDKLGTVQHGYSHFKLDMPVFTTSVRKPTIGNDLWPHRWCAGDNLQEIPIHNAAKKALSLVRDRHDLTAVKELDKEDQR